MAGATAAEEAVAVVVWATGGAVCGAVGGPKETKHRYLSVDFWNVEKKKMVYYGLVYFYFPLLTKGHSLK